LRARLGRPLLAVAFLAATAAVVAGCGAGPTRVEITFRHSHFVPGRITVPADRPVQILLRNEDPIDHEWIVGDPALHDRHRTGTEPVHDARPTEVTVPARSRRTTTITFPAGSTWTFVCHLPGHEAYGMVGTVVVEG
jgi:uncharacterized cupredoxin-like copper-binding protein